MYLLLGRGVRAVTSKRDQPLRIAADRGGFGTRRLDAPVDEKLFHEVAAKRNPRTGRSTESVS
jgi:hypothetical protein